MELSNETTKNVISEVGIHHYKMSNRLNMELNYLHNIIFEGKRLFNFSMISFDDNDVRTEFNRNKKNLLEMILEKSVEILQMLNINRFCRNNYVIDFHQRNCSESKKDKYHWSVWHEDDFQVTRYSVWTIIYYLRKDKGVKGGNIIYSHNKEIKEIETEEGDIIVQKGNIYHKPQELWGYGSRDTIVCFIKRKI